MTYKNNNEILYEYGKNTFLYSFDNSEVENITKSINRINAAMAEINTDNRKRSNMDSSTLPNDIDKFENVLRENLSLIISDAQQIWLKSLNKTKSIGEHLMKTTQYIENK